MIVLGLVVGGCAEGRREGNYAEASPASVPPGQTGARVAGREESSNTDPRDLALAHSISQILQGNVIRPNLGQNITATIDNGTVTLRGGVISEHQRDEIVDHVRRLPGVEHVEDQLILDYR